MNLSDVSAFDVARLAAAAAFGWGVVSALWKAAPYLCGMLCGIVLGYFCPQWAEECARTAAKRDDDNTPPGPTATA